MVETMTTEKLKPVQVITLVSSSRGNGDDEYIVSNYPFIKKDLMKGYIPHDTATHANVVIIHFRSETFGERERPLEEMLEHDIIVKMPPKNRFIIKARITRISKAEPKIIVDTENIYLEP